MAVGESTYNKYGGFGAPDMRALVAGQEALTTNIKDVFTGVEELFKQTEESYKETNTLNVQEYLQNKVKEQGLRADPIDTVAIQKKFGNMINMDKLDETFKTTKQQLELDTLNEASAVADQSFAETGDPLLARKKLTEVLKDAYNAPADYINRAVTSWSDANAVQIKDAEIQDLRDEEEGFSDILNLVSTGDVDEYQAIEAKVLEAPKHKQDALRKNYTDRLEDRKKLTETQQATLQHFTKNKQIENSQKLAQYDTKVALLEAQYAAVKDKGVTSSALEMIEGYNKSLDGSVKDSITKKLDNWVERIIPGLGEGHHFEKLHSNLIHNHGISPEKADAILLQAFKGSYRGDDVFFNNMERNELDEATAIAMNLAAEEGAKQDYIQKISEARQARVDVEAQGLHELNELERALMQAGQKQRLNVKHTPSIDDLGQFLSGANPQAVAPRTSKAPMPLAPEIAQKFTKAETQYGLPKGYLARTAELESANNPNAQNDNSSAKGMFQFIDDTAKQYGLDNPFDVALATDAAARLARDNFKVLSKNLGRAPTSAELYLAHQQGATGAMKLLADPDAKAVDVVGREAVRLNGGKKDMTAREFAGLWTDKFDNKSSAKAAGKVSKETDTEKDPYLLAKERVEQNEGMGEPPAPSPAPVPKPAVKEQEQQLKAKLFSPDKQQKTPWNIGTADEKGFLDNKFKQLKEHNATNVKSVEEAAPTVEKQAAALQGMEPAERAIELKKLEKKYQKKHMDKLRALLAKG